MPVIRNNFFDAVGSGTVRMEAFIEEKDTPPKERRKQGPLLGNSWARQPVSKKKDLRYWGIGGSSESVGVARGRSEDPFRGF